MITQDLFNKRPKTFMDYEPGKIPSSKDYTAQTTAQTQPKDPFASNVKIVGDDVTEKDYDTFFEGFRSVTDKLSGRQNSLWQEPKTPITANRPSVSRTQGLQKLPYIPSLHGENKVQKLPYRPSENGAAGISLYSATTPAYTQASDTSLPPQKTQEERQKIKEEREWKENLLRKMYETSVMTATQNPLFGLLRTAAGEVLEDHVKEKHYGRNQYNVDLPKNDDEAKARGWETEIANCHQFTTKNGEKYIKYVSPDGKREVIFDSTGTRVITADEDMGTYNYADPDLWLEHFAVDVLPWIVYGNTPEDTTEWYERIGGFLFGNQKDI
ncbi:MAG: hypothetical protein II996_02150 [Oscillospiraceae bacterium]|nr:hypothetical protein [Oscillospiraceae bacterium]